MEKNILKNLKKINEVDYNFDKKTKISILFAIAVISGVFGFVYEVLFYRIDLGYFVKRGTTVGPWIPIYGIGGFLMSVLVEKYKKYPIKVFALNAIICGILEYFTGYILYEYFGTRLWDYNIEIWNWGNIQGYICFRSVMFFGVSGMMLIYAINPIIKNIANKVSKNLFIFLSNIFFWMFLLDALISNLIL